MRAFDINELNWKEFTRLRSDLVLKLKTKQKFKGLPNWESIAHVL